MSKKKLTKEERIKKEISRLNRIFKDLDKNKKAVVQSLIRNAAFMAITLDDLQEIINRESYAEEYRNGKDQSGKKQSTELKTHIAMTKNLGTIIKQLVDLCPPERRKESRLAALQRE